MIKQIMPVPQNMVVIKKVYELPEDEHGFKWFAHKNDPHVTPVVEVIDAVLIGINDEGFVRILEFDNEYNAFTDDNYEPTNTWDVDYRIVTREWLKEHKPEEAF